MTAVGITVDGQEVYGPSTATRIEVDFPPVLFEQGHDYVLSRCQRCKTPLRQLDSGSWVDTLDNTGCAASVPIAHDPEPVPPARVRKVVVEIGELLGITVHVDGWQYPVSWHVTKDGYHKVEPQEHREFRIVQPGGPR